jgi:SAM-dependent methyltransferase
MAAQTQQTRLSGKKSFWGMRIVDQNTGRHIHEQSYKWYLDGTLRPLLFNRATIYGPYVKPGMRVLDVGCGAGFNALGMARLVGETGLIVAADIQQAALDELERRARKQDLFDVVYIHKCGETGLGVEGRYDFANAFWMLHETPDAKTFLRELFGLLKPGARLLVAEPRFHVSPEQFRAELEAARHAGFSIAARPRIRMSHAVILERPAIPIRKTQEPAHPANRLFVAN